MTNTETRCGFCAIIGAPNAGKSTLVNALAGAKVSIVSHKVQTTRSRLRAIVIAGASQIVFVDTPGIFKPKRTLDEAMVEGAWSGASEADAVVLLADVRKGLNDEVLAIIEGLRKYGIQAFLALNKIDLVKAETLLDLARTFNEAFAFRETFMISALNKSGIDRLKDKIAGLMPAGPWLYAEDQIADVPLRFIAAETTREKVYERLHEELPYSSTVETENWEERKDGSVRIDQVIYVERESQRKIVLGKNGQTIKALGQAARLDLEKALERRVHLFLFVKVRENWAKDPERLRMMGLLD
ncbi:GTPase Era [Nordella sp. HKS 07]|uniref:GTPase Era n=1 Tax=Nordella sp. HKS 07 TaxID=2712222 RepID=UPI0013E18B42|nr:GTPase Era [Nordella sp. HKS 07]QIG51188.1 GTPase Era [Nordella sp. HKS 07]